MSGSTLPIDMQYNSDPHHLWSYDMETIEHQVFAADWCPGKSILNNKLALVRLVNDPWRALEIVRRNYRNLKAWREKLREQMTDSGIAAGVPDPRTPDLIRRFDIAKMQAFRRGVYLLGAYPGPVHRSVAKHSQTGY